MRTPTELERSFEWLYSQLCADLPKPDPEIPWYVYHLDFAWAGLKIVVECEGIDHQRPATYHKDIRKYNFLAEEGWLLLRCTTRMLRDDPQSFFDQLRRTIERRMKDGR